MSSMLQQVRKSHGLKQTDVAARLKITDRMYQRYEAGKSSPPLEKAFMLSELFNTPIEVLFQYNRNGGEREGQS